MTRRNPGSDPKPKSGNPFVMQGGVIRSYANERERGRTQSVNGAFQHLRDLIPTEPVDRKLSKIETLRLATSYIEHLATQLTAGQVKSKPEIIPRRQSMGLQATQSEGNRYSGYGEVIVNTKLELDQDQSHTWGKVLVHTTQGVFKARLVAYH